MRSFKFDTKQCARTCNPIERGSIEVAKGSRKSRKIMITTTLEAWRINGENSSLHSFLRSFVSGNLGSVIGAFCGWKRTKGSAKGPEKWRQGPFRSHLFSHSSARGYSISFSLLQTSFGLLWLYKHAGLADMRRRDKNRQNWSCQREMGAI